MNNKQELLLSIEETLQLYRYDLKKNPKFGIDVFSKDFKVEDVVIVQKDGFVSKGTPVRFGFFALFLCLEGESIRSVNQYEYKICKCSLQLLPPGSIFSFESITEKTEVHILAFTEEFIKAYTQEHVTESIKLLFEYHKSNIDNVILPSGLFTRVKNIYDDINIELHEKHEDHLSVVKLLILQLLFILKRCKMASYAHEINFDTKAEKIAYQFLDLVEKHFLEFKKVADYAKLLKITSKHLGETVKLVLGNNALFYIHSRTYKEALYLLKYTNMNISEISSLLSFDNPSQFSRFFKSYCQMSPSNYRLNTHATHLASSHHDNSTEV